MKSREELIKENIELKKKLKNRDYCNHQIDWTPNGQGFGICVRCKMGASSLRMRGEL